VTDDSPDGPAPMLVSPALIAVFAEPGFDPVEVDMADLVTVRMDGNYQVLKVSLRRATDQKPDTNRQLELALAEAFNEAVRQVMHRNAERLTSLLETGTSAGGERPGEDTGHAT